MRENYQMIFNTCLGQKATTDDDGGEDDDVGYAERK